MNSSKSSQHLNVQFNGRMGSVVINQEKITFCPPAESTSPPRSWPMKKLRSVEIMDHVRGTTYQSLKLKSNKNKTVTFSVPRDRLGQIVEDINGKLPSDALGFEGLVPSQTKTPLVNKHGKAATATRRKTWSPTTNKGEPRQLLPPGA